MRGDELASYWLLTPCGASGALLVGALRGGGFQEDLGGWSSAHYDDIVECIAVQNTLKSSSMMGFAMGGTTR